MILSAVQPPTQSDPDSVCHVMLAVRVIVVDSGNGNDGIVYV